MQKSRNNNGSTNKKSIEKNYQKKQQNSKDCNTAKAGKSSFNWYPGHMTKAKRMMEENIRLIDLVIEIVDARVPMSSRNPDIDKLASNKARIILLNKADLADDYVTNKWIAYFNSKNIYCLKLNSRDNSGVKQVNNLIQTACADKIERDKSRGIMNRTIKAMVVGIPNVGKSTFINSFAGKASAKTGNKPGVTKGKQWIKLGKNVEMLDTPGILWPRFENQDVGMRLAMIGSINDNILNIEELAIDTINYVYNNYPDNIIERYELDKEAVKASYDESAINPDNSIALYIMEQAALKRGCIKKGNAIDYEKTANIILDDFRSGRLGRITLERSEDNANS
ncbi:MAG: ribosome biogenesis GTPase YlqF [Lachnospira sp.]|nr:ribosome biogenesis GTPase YlqF [Lachnospira sp.]